MIHTDCKVRLLNPGPVTLSARVRRALTKPDLCHREEEFAELMGDVRRRLAAVYDQTRDEYDAVLLTGSGTAAVEAMVSSLVPAGQKALVVANGVYGERIAKILETHGKAADVVRSEWTAPMDLAAAEKALAASPRYSHVIAVHHETTTGRLNDLAALGEICRSRSVPLLLDTVSSFAGEAIDFSGINIEACAATANKCLHGVPGISFVVFRKSALAERPSPAASLYLDLFENYRAQRQGTPLFTPAVQVVYALQEALIELEEDGGWQRRHRRYQRHSERVRDALRERGVDLLLPDASSYASMLSSFRLPNEVTFHRLHAYLKQSGFIIYPGQQSLADVIFRVAVMGDLDDHDIDELNDRLADFFLS